MKRKVVYNDCYGGFRLSSLAVKRYYELKFPEVTLYFYAENYDGGNFGYTKIKHLSKDDRYYHVVKKDFGDQFSITREDRQNDSQLYKDFNDNYIYLESHIKRDDPVLVQVVEELGDEASGPCSELKVADIGDSKYHIDEYDGWETITTQLPDDYWQ